MAFAHIDHLEDLSCMERGGVVIALTRRARVVDLISTDYTVLWSALEAAGIPKVPSGLIDPNTNLPSTGFEALVLANRGAKVVDRDKGTVDVTLEYEKLLDNQETEQPAGLALDGILYGKARCSISQKPTNFYWDYSVNPRQRTAITVSHIFPVGKEPTGTAKGQAVTQGGEIQVMVPQKNYQVVGYLNIDNPYIVSDNLIATVNSLAWMNGDPRQWICSEVGFEIMGLSAPDPISGVKTRRYRFSFEFQHNPDGWDNEVVFIDARTGRPPEGLVDGVGRKVVKYLRGVDFNAELSVFFEGWAAFA